MTRTKKFIYNTIATALLQIVNMAVGFILPKIMLVYYGSEINGLVSSITQFITYFSLVEAGLSSAAIYALYKPLADNDHKAISAVVTAAKRFYTLSGYIFVSLTAALAIIYPMFIKTEMLTAIEVGILVLILGVSGALDFFTLSKYRALLTADQKTYIISVASIAYIVLNLIITVVLAKLSVNIVVLKGVALCSVFLRTAILAIYVRIKYSYVNYKEPPNNKALDKRWDALFLQVLGTVQNATPVVLTTFLTTLKTVSVYTIFNMVLSGLNGLLSIFPRGLNASFGELLAKKQTEVLHKAYRDFEFTYYYMIAVIYSVAFLCIMSFVGIYTKNVRDANYNVPLYGILFVMNGLFYNIKTPQGMLVGSAGLYKETRWQTMAQAIIGIVFGTVLGIWLGLAGIMIGLILSNLYRDIDLIFFIPKYVTKLSPVETVGRVVRMFAVIGIVIVSAKFFPIQAENYFQWAVYAFVAMLYAMSVSIILALIFDRREFNSVLFRIKGMVGGKKK